MNFDITVINIQFLEKAESQAILRIFALTKLPVIVGFADKHPKKKC